MKNTVIALAALWLGCSSNNLVPPTQTDGATDTPVADADVLTCEPGYVQGYPQGCSAAPTCVRDTSGDAVAITFCGCDGVTHTTGGQWPPAVRWASSTACEDGGAADGGSDVGADVALTCPLPPIDTSACVSDVDCTTAARGCYCGQQPVVGVSLGYADAVRRCEAEAAGRCALGCPVALGQVAQDGQSPGDGGAIAVRCERVDGGAGSSCRTYVR